jgi:DMSO reductase iron-sulfur subunit
VGKKQYAFYFDARACSGCKTCQVACKDKNGLELGILWRRVYEVEGGGWHQDQSAWKNSVFAYYVSMACNHCEDPVCRDVCPTGAIHKRQDGIVLIDSSLCIGCEYCSWACPYGAPQYDSARGIMTKCTFCVDDIDLGRSPACVSACPMRVLDFGDRAELEMKYGVWDDIFPLPPKHLTCPAVLIQPHKRSVGTKDITARIANKEEIS